MFRTLFITLMLLILIGCDSPNTQTPDLLSSQGEGQSSGGSDGGVAKTPGVTLNGGDQGREGGHFLICMPEGQVPDSRTLLEKKDNPQPEKIFFVDYFVTVKTDQHRKKLYSFHGELDDAIRLDMVTKRLLKVFDSMPAMKRKAMRMMEYSHSFMDRKGRARWIESTDLPYELPLTTDFTPKHLDREELSFVIQYCQSRFFQAAIYDYSDPGQEIFYYSEFFEENASATQKSFRNIHELLRFMMRDETPQVIQLTHYFHTKDFFNNSLERVRQKISGISAVYKNHESFYED